jgi:phosphomannomutase/phosphoglucomutase
VTPHIFREFDIRGLVDAELTEAGFERLGRGLGTVVRRRGGRAVVVGRDCRASSPRFQEALVRGLTATGLAAWDVGVGPTPLVYFAAHTLPVDGLAVVTGSHNPPEYNGLKAGAGRTTFHGEELQGLRRLVEAEDFETAPAPGPVRPFDVLTPYLHFVQQTVALGRRGVRVVVDAGSGVGGVVAVPLLRALGCEVVPLHCEMDGRFPHHHPDPTVEENLRDLVEAVARERADVGVAYDGDADRLGVVDERGGILWGDQLTLLFARAVLAEVPGATVVGEVKCSSTLFDGVAERGGTPVMWKAGHSLIKQKMQETGAELGGEMSGHVFFKHRYFGFDDALYATARLLELLTSTAAPLSALLADVPRTFVSPELRLPATDAGKHALVRRATELLRAAGHTVVDVDGARVTFPDGWGLLRASGTQPLLTLRFEATSEARLGEIRALVEGTLARVRRELGA